MRHPAHSGKVEAEWRSGPTSKDRPQATRRPAASMILGTDIENPLGVAAVLGVERRTVSSGKVAVRMAEARAEASASSTMGYTRSSMGAPCSVTPSPRGDGGLVWLSVVSSSRSFRPATSAANKLGIGGLSHATHQPRPPSTRCPDRHPTVCASLHCSHGGVYWSQTLAVSWLRRPSCRRQLDPWTASETATSTAGQERIHNRADNEPVSIHRTRGSTRPIVHAPGTACAVVIFSGALPGSQASFWHLLSASVQCLCTVPEPRCLVQHVSSSGLANSGLSRAALCHGQGSQAGYAVSSAALARRTRALSHGHAQ